MTLNQLRYFCTASRCHSITKAAEELYVTQPTVSTAIRDLEIEFGISLFYRKGNQLILTGEGETLYEKANYILQYCTELQSFTMAVFTVRRVVATALKFGYVFAASRIGICSYKKASC